MVKTSIDYPDNYTNPKTIRAYCEKKAGRKILVCYIDPVRKVMRVKKFGEKLPVEVEEKPAENSNQNKDFLEA